MSKLQTNGKKVLLVNPKFTSTDLSAADDRFTSIKDAQDYAKKSIGDIEVLDLVIHPAVGIKICQEGVYYIYIQ